MHQSKMTLVGRLLRDPELRQVGESWVVNFGVAVDTEQRLTAAQREEMGEENEYATATAYWNCAAWGNWPAALVNNGSLVKGVRVAVEGDVLVDPITHGPEAFERKDGTPGASLKLRCSNGRGGLIVLDSRAERAAAGNATSAAVVDAPFEEEEEEIIF